MNQGFLLHESPVKLHESAFYIIRFFQLVPDKGIVTVSARREAVWSQAGEEWARVVGTQNT